VFDVLLVLVVKELGVLVLVDVALRRLVGQVFLLEGHCVHFTLGFLKLSLLALLLLQFALVLFNLACSFGSLGDVFLLLVLDFAELVKDVLVVKERVSKLFLEEISLQEPGDPLFDDGNLEDLVDGRASSGVTLEHHANKLVQLG